MSRGCIFVANMLIARKLGAENYGFFSVFYFVMIVGWQIFQPFDRTFVRYSVGMEDKQIKLEFLRSALFCKLVLSALVLIFAFPLSSFLAKVAFNKPAVAPFLVISFLSMTGLGFLSFLSCTYQAEEKYFIYSIFNTFYSFSILVICLLFIIFDVSFSILRMSLIFYFVTVIIGIICLIVLINRFGLALPRDLKILEKSVNLSKWMLGIMVAFFIFQRIDLFLITKYLDFKVVGIYSVAVQFLVVVTFLASSATGIFLPKASMALKEKQSYAAFKKEALLIASLINFVTLLLFLFAPVLIKNFYGNEYAESANICRVLLVGNFFLIYYLPFSYLFYTVEKAKVRFSLEVTKTVLAVLLLLTVLPRAGVIGGAFVMAFTIIVYSITSFLIIRRYVRAYLKKIEQPNLITTLKGHLC